MDKVIVLLSENWHGNTTETLWVVPWFKENSFQIKNVPFYVKGISLDDIIIAEEIDGIKFFRSVLKNGGHSTYRIFLNENIREETFETYWLPLQNLGCTYEKAFIRFYSIDVPAETDVNKAYVLLENGEKNHIWDFEEGKFGHELS
jgi:Domain of unknown function (DUF4265)